MSIEVNFKMIKGRVLEYMYHSKGDLGIMDLIQ